MKRFLTFFILVPAPFILALAQLETEWIDTNTNKGSSHLLFFTNRPMFINDSGFVDFVDKYQFSTDTLTFGTYHSEGDTTF